SWVVVWAKDRGISTAISSNHDIIYSSHKLPAIAVGIPSAQLLPGHVEFQDCAGVVSTREEECFLFRERQPVMTAALRVIQHGSRFAIPFRERVGDPANIVKVAVNVQWTLG